MLDLTLVNWWNDRITRNFIVEHEAELANPESMSPVFLAEAATYCREYESPFSEELVRKAGMWDRYTGCYDPKERRKIIHGAAKSFGIIMF